MRPDDEAETANDGEEYALTLSSRDEDFLRMMRELGDEMIRACAVAIPWLAAEMTENWRNNQGDPEVVQRLRAAKTHLDAAGIYVDGHTLTRALTAPLTAPDEPTDSGE